MLVTASGVAHSSSLARASSPLPTPSAGLPNTGNSFYMNTVLQIIAALYADQVQNGPLLEKLIDTISTTHQPLDSSDINVFITSLPSNLQHMAKSNDQHDPEVIITHLNTQEPLLDSIKSTTRLTIQQQNSKTLLEKESPPLKPRFFIEDRV